MHDDINNWLWQRGVNLSGQRLWKLVFSDDEYETRSGTFNDFYGDIYLRTVSGIRRVPKYPYIRSRWILERWIPPEISYTSELPDSRQGSYEPIYVFEDSKGTPLEVNRRVVELIVNFAEKGPERTSRERADELRNEHKEREQRQYQQDYDSIDTNEVLSALHMKEGIVNKFGETKYGGKE